MEGCSWNVKRGCLMSKIYGSNWIIATSTFTNGHKHKCKTKPGSLFLWINDDGSDNKPQQTRWKKERLSLAPSRNVFDRRWLMGAATNLIALTSSDTSRSITVTVSCARPTELCMLNGTLSGRQMTARLRRRVRLQMPPVSWRRQVSSEAIGHTVRSIRWNYRGTERHSHRAGSAQVAVNKSWGAGHREGVLW